MTAMPEPDFDGATLVRLGEGESRRIRRLASAFLATTDRTLAEIADAIGRCDLRAASGFGHQLKSSARWVGAPALGLLAERLEHLAAGADPEPSAGLLAEMRLAYERVREGIAEVVDALPADDGGAMP